MAEWPAPVQGNRKAPVPPLDVDLARAWSMVQRNRDVYLKTWKTNFIPPLIEPLLYLLSIGIGVGALINGIDDGLGHRVSYRQFVAPGILAITMMQVSFGETTYNSFIRMWFQKTWEAITATPMTLDDVLVGELAWAAMKGAINAFLMAIVIALFGLLPWTMVPLVVPVALLVGMGFAGIGLCWSALVKGIDGFSFAMYLFMTPMMLFAGTFFPLAQLPRGAELVARALPLTNAVLVLRPISLGRPLEVPGVALLYLAVAAVAFPLLSIYLMKRKLAT
ncbi:MAG: lipooligosaccharide transport system permease protein [Thermoplasmata archaeon]|jgi:lipooligosaccharide transport system permease protein|nr:lipooligosaccharide transport system permease protein [Thermoplasmata archaeon]